MGRGRRSARAAAYERERRRRELAAERRRSRPAGPRGPRRVLLLYVDVRRDVEWEPGRVARWAAVAMFAEDQLRITRRRPELLRGQTVAELYAAGCALADRLEAESGHEIDTLWALDGDHAAWAFLVRDEGLEPVGRRWPGPYWIGADVRRDLEVEPGRVAPWAAALSLDLRTDFPGAGEHDVVVTGETVAEVFAAVNAEAERVTTELPGRHVMTMWALDGDLEAWARLAAREGLTDYPGQHTTTLPRARDRPPAP